MIRRLFSRQTAFSAVEYGIFAVFFGIWTLIALEAVGAIS